jgi:stress response protein YsnF
MLEHKTKQIQTTLMALSLAALGAGCSSTHPRYYSGSDSGAASTTSSRFSDSSGGSSQSYQASSETRGTRSGANTQVSGDQIGGDTVIPLYEEQVRVGTREVDAGAVRLRKVVTTETVNQPVQVRHETVVIDREPAGNQNQNQPGQGASNLQQQQGASGQAFQEQEIVIHLKKEEPVVETQVVPTGRVVAQKKVQSQQQSVQRQIRREDIQVEKIGNPENVIISENLRNARQRDATGAGGGATGQSQGSGTNSNTRQGENP